MQYTINYFDNVTTLVSKCLDIEMRITFGMANLLNMPHIFNFQMSIKWFYQTKGDFNLLLKQILFLHKQIYTSKAFMLYLWLNPLWINNYKIIMWHWVEDLILN